MLFCRRVINSSGVAAASVSAGRRRNGPPLAVSTIRRTSSSEPVRRAWWMAECSLSTGTILPPVRSASRITSGPAITSVSLLASATVLPASRADQVLRSPAAPTMAETTRSTSAACTRSSSASGPTASRVPGGRPDGSTAAAASGSTTTTHRGRQARACATRASTLRLAASRNGTKRPPEAAITSSVLLPMLPVEPSTATPRPAPAAESAAVDGEGRSLDGADGSPVEAALGGGCGMGSRTAGSGGKQRSV